MGGASSGIKGTLNPHSTHLNNEPVPQVLKQVVNLSCLLYSLLCHKENIIWSEHVRLYEKDYKTTRNNIVETTGDIDGQMHWQK